jgi:hypothetical protein
MLPREGERWSLGEWSARLEEADYPLEDEAGNGLNRVILAHSWFGLLEDSPVDIEKPHRVCARFYAQTSYPAGLNETVRVFSKLGYALLRASRRPGGRPDDALFRAFAATPVFREYYAWRRTKDPAILTYLLSFLWWGRKAPAKSTPEKSAASLDRWLSIQSELKGITLPWHVVVDLRRLIRLSGFKYDRAAAWPQFGPRQVAERLKTITPKTKIDRLMLSASTREYYARLIQAHASKGRYKFLDLVLPTFGALQRENPFDYARWMDIHKDAFKRRTICMEPNDRMFFQQGLLGAIRQGIDDSKFSQLTSIEDQSPNRRFALKGSLGELATIDCEDASDRVLWALVEGVMPYELVRDLDDTRSKRVRIYNTNIVIRPETAFPMGSGVCFPIQCMIFGAQVALCHVLQEKTIGIEEYLSGGVSVVDAFPEIIEGSRVYGDDIIVPENMTGTMIVLLEALGFKVNRDKTFSGDLAVRESCGVFAWNGNDVTPITFKVKSLEMGSYKSWIGLIALSNGLYRHRYFGAREKLLRYIPHECYVELSPDSPFAHHPSSLHGNPVERLKTAWSKVLGKRIARKRFDPDWQVWVVQLLTEQTLSTRDTIRWHEDHGDGPPLAQEGIIPLHDELERYEYGRWSNKPSMTEGKAKSPRHGLSTPVSARLRWTPVAY